jgi:hypothetical protein
MDKARDIVFHEEAVAPAIPTVKAYINNLGARLGEA